MKLGSIMVNRLNILKELLPLLFCPDDRGNLYYLNDESLKCNKCGRKFRVYNNNFVELLPSAQYKRQRNKDKYHYIIDNYWSEYYKFFNEKFNWNDKAIAWGAFEITPERYKIRKQKEIQIINELTRNCGGIFCDVSAGAGLFTLPYSKEFDIVINCDLSVDNLNYVHKKAIDQKINNILFIRCDHLSLPLKPESINLVISVDTLIYGSDHDLKLLSEIERILDSSGCAVVDFSNKFHKIPLIKRPCYRYRAYEIKKVLKKIGLQKFMFVRFVQENLGFFNRLIPATRFVVKIIKDL